MARVNCQHDLWKQGRAIRGLSTNRSIQNTGVGGKQPQQDPETYQHQNQMIDCEVRAVFLSIHFPEPARTLLNKSTTKHKKTLDTPLSAKSQIERRILRIKRQSGILPLLYLRLGQLIPPLATGRNAELIGATHLDNVVGHGLPGDLLGLKNVAVDGKFADRFLEETNLW